MLRGDFAAAWNISDRILQRRARAGERTHELPRHWQWLWDGRALTGARVLVHCYHGLGDTIQFVRLLPRLHERCATVALWAQPALLDLLRDAPGIDRLVALHDGAPGIARDCDVELMELPHILRLMPDEIPARVPYLGSQFPRAGRDPRQPPRIGLCWRAGDWNAARSVPESALAPLARLRGVQWFSLQYPALPTPFPMRNLACRDLRVFAQRLCSLDLVISVDTLSAHLAGALGLPTWTLLPADCDWRWMRARADSPWYPTMRLIRQPQVGGWENVIGQVASMLKIHAWAFPRERAAGEPAKALDSRLRGNDKSRATAEYSA